MVTHICTRILQCAKLSCPRVKSTVAGHPPYPHPTPHPVPVQEDPAQYHTTPLSPILLKSERMSNPTQPTHISPGRCIMPAMEDALCSVCDRMCIAFLFSCCARQCTHAVLVNTHRSTKCKHTSTHATPALL